MLVLGAHLLMCSTLQTFCCDSAVVASRLSSWRVAYYPGFATDCLVCLFADPASQKSSRAPSPVPSQRYDALEGQFTPGSQGETKYNQKKRRMCCWPFASHYCVPDMWCLCHTHTHTHIPLGRSSVYSVALLWLSVAASGHVFLSTAAIESRQYLLWHVLTHSAASAVQWSTGHHMQQSPRKARPVLPPWGYLNKEYLKHPVLSDKWTNHWMMGVLSRCNFGVDFYIARNLCWHIFHISDYRMSWLLCHAVSVYGACPPTPNITQYVMGNPDCIYPLLLRISVWDQAWEFPCCHFPVRSIHFCPHNTSVSWCCEKRVKKRVLLLADGCWQVLLFVVELVPYCWEVVHSGQGVAPLPCVEYLTSWESWSFNCSTTSVGHRSAGHPTPRTWGCPCLSTYGRNAP